MNKPEFDQYAEQYDRLMGEAIPEGLNEDGYFAEYKIALMAKTSATEPTAAHPGFRLRRWAQPALS